MADDPDAADPELEIPASPVEQETVEDAPELDPETPVDEFVEIERGGKTYRVPKELEGEFLMQADYTKKRQADAEKAKALESREAEINQKAEATEAELDARADLATVNKQLAEFAKLTPQDWQAHLMNDPLGTQQAQMAYQMLKDQKAELEGKVGKASKERTEKAQQEFAKRVQDTLEAAKKIPGWKPERLETLLRFAQTEGVPESVLRNIWSPATLMILHKAQLGDQLMKRQTTAPKPTVAESPQPLRTVTARTTPATPGLSDRLGTEEWVKRFNKQRLAKRG